MHATAWLYVLITAAIAALTAVQGEIAAGRAPIPPEYAWLTPVLTALLAALTSRLRAIGRPGE